MINFSNNSSLIVLPTLEDIKIARLYAGLTQARATQFGSTTQSLPNLIRGDQNGKQTHT